MSAKEVLTENSGGKERVKNGRKNKIKKTNCRYKEECKDIQKIYKFRRSGG